MSLGKMAITRRYISHFFVKNLSLFFVSLFNISALAFGQNDQTVAFTIPSAGVVTAGQPEGYFKIQENNTVTVQVTCTFTDSVATRNGSGVYQVQFEGLTWLPVSTPDVSFSKVSQNDQNRKTSGIQLVSTAAPKTPAIGSRRVVDVVGYPVADNSVIAIEGSNIDSASKVPVLNFGLVSRFEDATVNDFTVKVNSVGGFAQATILYLFEGSVLLDLASVTGGVSRFEGLNLSITKNTARYLSIKADVVQATVFPTRLQVKIDSEDMVLATQATRATGVADSGDITIRNVGVMSAVLSSSIGLSAVVIGDGKSSVVRNTVTARYSISLMAVGGDVIIPKQSHGQTFRFALYRNGLLVQ